MDNSGIVGESSSSMMVAVVVVAVMTVVAMDDLHSCGGSAGWVSAKLPRLSLLLDDIIIFRGANVCFILVKVWCCNYSESGYSVTSCFESSKKRSL